MLARSAQVLLFLVACDALSPIDLTVGIHFDLTEHLQLPQGSTLGIAQVWILQRALPSYAFHYIQLPREELNVAVSSGRVDVALDVPCCSDQEPMLLVKDSAITSIRAIFEIDSIDDLVGNRVLSFEGADMSLGPEFERHFGPDGTDRRNYREFNDVFGQVLRFWDDGYDIATLDAGTFASVTNYLGYCEECVVFHDIFPQRSISAVFASSLVRQQFIHGKQQLCEQGLNSGPLGASRKEVKLACAAQIESIAPTRWPSFSTTPEPSAAPAIGPIARSSWSHSHSYFFSEFR